jgi:hypothetical protein
MPNGGQVSNTGDDNPVTGFTGIRLNATNSTLQVYENGALAGSAVSVGTLLSGQYYALSYDVDTATGSLSNVMFDGSPVSGLSSTAFTDAATSFVGVLTEEHASGALSSLTVSSVPEPTAIGIAVSIGGLGILRRRRHHAR